MALRVAFRRSALQTRSVTRLAVTAARPLSTQQQRQRSHQEGSRARWGYAAAGAAAAAVAVSSVALAQEKKKGKVDYQAVRQAIADILDVENYDDGSYIPVLIRLAWHASGTYDKATGTGGSNGATMRFPPESTDGANAGLHVARKLLEPIKAKFPDISYADLWTLAGVVAVEEAGGPVVPWRPGRVDYTAEDKNRIPPNGRLPDASQGEDHVRAVFYRMGFNDQEIVALLGAHSLGRAHRDRSGYDGPWTRAPTTFSNEFYRLLLEDTWTVRNWDGPRQFENKDKDLMMLPADMVLRSDPHFRFHVEHYAKDEEAFRKDFAAAFSKLLELGVPFDEDKFAAAASASWFKKISSKFGGKAN